MRLLMDSSALNSEPLNMIDEADDGRDSDQIQGCKRTRHVSPALLGMCGTGHALAPSRFRRHR